MNAESVTLGAGEEYQLEYDIFTADTRNNNSIAYISDNEEVAVVDDNGVLLSAYGLDADGDLINDYGEAVIDGAFVELTGWSLATLIRKYASQETEIEKEEE